MASLYILKLQAINNCAIFCYNNKVFSYKIATLYIVKLQAIKDCTIVCYIYKVSCFNIVTPYIVELQAINNCAIVWYSSKVFCISLSKIRQISSQINGQANKQEQIRAKRKKTKKYVIAL